MRTEDFVFSGIELLMPLDTPLLRVSRPVAACQRCRTAKIKCDGKLPACSACERSNRASECSSTNDQFAKGKERSYVATLEARVERLEKQIGEVRARRKSSLQMLDAAISPRRISIDENGKPKNVRAARRKELSDIDELVSDFGFLTVNATSRDFYGFTSAISYSKLILGAAIKESLPVGMSKDWPPRYSLQPLVQHYLNTTHLILPIIEETSFYTSVDAVYNVDSQKATYLDHWNVRLVLAIASAMKSQQRGDTYYSDAVGHICAALGLAEQVLHPGSVWSIQALLLLVIFALLDPAHFDSWTLIGAASRMMVDLGMHQDPSKSVNMSRAKLELRRRVFWCVYALDRSTSIVQMRSFSFSDDASSVALPFASRPMSPGSIPRQPSMWVQSNESALNLFKLRQMQSACYTQLFQSGREAWADPYSYIWPRYQELSDWFNKLSSGTLPATRDFFELELLYTYVYILSPSPRCPKPNEHAQRLIFEQAVSYADKMRSITTNPTEAKNPLTFYDAIRVYTTGTLFLSILSSNTETLLRPNSSTPISGLTTSNSLDAEVDPLAPQEATAPPPIPFPAGDTPGDLPKDQTTRAIDAINNFVEILSYFGLRFGIVGGINHRERFQRDSQPVLTRLFQRQAQMEQNFSTIWNGGPVTPPTHLSTSPRSSFYPSPDSSHYSQASPLPSHGNQQHHDMVTQSMNGWHHLAPTGNQFNTAGNSNYMTTTVPDMPVAPLAYSPVVMDNLGIGSYAAWETLPGGNLNARFA